MRIHKTLTFPLTLLLLLTGVPSAEAILVDFENLPTATPGTGGFSLTQPTLSGGFSFTTIAGTLQSMGANASTVIADNGTTSLALNSNTPGAIVMAHSAAQPFDLLSFDAAEMFTLALDANALSIDVTGNVEGGGTVNTSYTLDMVRDGIGGVQDFEQFVLPGSFQNLTSVTFAGMGVGGQNDFQIDEIQALLSSSGPTTSAIPEPGTLWLLGLGFFMLRTAYRGRVTQDLNDGNR